MRVEVKKYLMGEHHAEWECISREYQDHDGYKIVLYDKDTGEMIQTNYLTPSTMNLIDREIETLFYHSDKFESLNDVYTALKNGVYGTLFHIE